MLPSPPRSRAATSAAGSASAGSASPGKRGLLASACSRRRTARCGSTTRSAGTAAGFAGSAPRSARRAPLRQGRALAQERQALARPDRREHRRPCASARARLAMAARRRYGRVLGRRSPLVQPLPLRVRQDEGERTGWRRVDTHRSRSRTPATRSSTAQGTLPRHECLHRPQATRAFAATGRPATRASGAGTTGTGASP